MDKRVSVESIWKIAKNNSEYLFVWNCFCRQKIIFSSLNVGAIESRKDTNKCIVSTVHKKKTCSVAYVVVEKSEVLTTGQV